LALKRRESVMPKKAPALDVSAHALAVAVEVEPAATPRTMVFKTASFKKRESVMLGSAVALPAPLSAADEKHEAVALSMPPLSGKAAPHTTPIESLDVPGRPLSAPSEPPGADAPATPPKGLMKRPSFMMASLLAPMGAAVAGPSALGTPGFPDYRRRSPCRHH
jgi:hypothetical protein